MNTLFTLYNKIKKYQNCIVTILLFENCQLVKIWGQAFLGILSFCNLAIFKPSLFSHCDLND